MLRKCIDFVEDVIKDRKESSTAEEKRVALQISQNPEARALPFGRSVVTVVSFMRNSAHKYIKDQQLRDEVGFSNIEPASYWERVPYTVPYVM
jgi:hypothetical protein